MIYPVPSGVNPNNSRCGCGGQLKMPWNPDRQDHILVCRDDPAHDTYQTKYQATRKLYQADGSQVEVYMATGKEIGGAIEIKDQATALARVEKALDMGLFPESAGHAVTPVQKEALAIVALAYGLDPIMGELIPYQGKPYVTIKGRRRKDDEAGHHGDLSYRLMTPEETEYYTNVGALKKDDVAGFCVIRDVDTGAKVEAFGRLLGSERTGQGSAFLPQGQRPIEMAQKRQEMRAREMLWGPIARPKGLEGPTPRMEGDEANVIEGQGHVVDDSSPPEPSDLGQGALGICPDHQAEWTVRENDYGQVNAFHAVPDSPWCRFGKVFGVIFQDAYTVMFDEYKKAEADAWLKEHFDGRTWSKMEPRQMLEAINKLVPGEMEGPAETNELPEGE